VYVLETAALTVLLGLGCLSWQQLRFMRARKRSAQDGQSVFHRHDVFHLILYFRVPEGERVIETTREFWRRIRNACDVRLVYAGQAVFATDSKQLPHTEWSGIVVLQFPNRAGLEAPEVQSPLREARELFAESYLHGMQRNCYLSLVMPQVLLALRLKDLLRGRWRWPSLEKLPAFDTFPQYDVWRSRISRLRASHTINLGGLVVYYLVRNRDPGELLGNQDDSAELLSRMAAEGFGPLHIGRSRTLEGSERFDPVFAIHYPSAAYFAELVASRFYQGIVSGQHLVDTLSMPTVPVTAHVV
jgi:hypothetical protein